MTSSVLVLNSGSSSVKYSVVEPDSGATVADGIVERIGDATGVPDHGAALEVVFGALAGMGARRRDAAGGEPGQPAWSYLKRPT